MKKLKFLENLKKEKISTLENYIDLLRRKNIKIKKINISYNERGEKEINIEGQEKE